MPIVFGFAEASYSVTEGSDVNVCIDYTSGDDLANEICLMVYISTLCKYITQVVCVMLACM